MKKAANTGQSLDIEQAYIDHNDWLLTIVKRRVHTAMAIVEEACSHAWEQAFRHRDSLGSKPREHLRAWLALTAKREAWRLHGERDGLGFADYADTIAETFDRPDHLEAIVAKLTAEGLLDGLNERQKQILILWAAEFSYDEIVELVGCSLTAVNKTLVKIKARIRRNAS